MSHAKRAISYEVGQQTRADKPFKINWLKYIREPPELQGKDKKSVYKNL